MKMLKPKPLNLTERQSDIWDAVNATKFDRNEISYRSGLSVSAIASYIAGRQEPPQKNYEYVMQAIEQLNTKGLDL